jgi:hypothetical protein
MSADRHADRARARCRDCRSPPRDRTDRSSSVGSSDDAAPRSDVEPTSSWSNMHTIGTAPSPALAATSVSASTAAQHEARLSSRAEPTSSSSRPTTAPGARSWSMRSHPRTSVASTPSSWATNPTSPPVPVPAPGVAPAGGSMPQIGVRWCWASTSRPAVFTSRSRWMASWGMAHTGRSTRRRRTKAPVPLRRTATRPDRPRSRFIQLVRRTPPYASTPTCRTPARTTSGWGLIRRLGLSVWAPTMRKPSWGLWPAAVAHATSVPPRTTNHRPGSPVQAASSASRENPASVSSAAAVAQAW